MLRRVARLDAVVLDLDGDLAAVVEVGDVHLAERGRGELREPPAGHDVGAPACGQSVSGGVEARNTGLRRPRG